MVTEQFLFSKSLNLKQGRILAYGSVVLYLLCAMVWAFTTHATWDDDCPTRVFNTLNAFQEPENFISPWNRPLFVLLFAVPVQAGFWTVPVLMSLLTAASGWALYHGVKKLGAPNAWLVLPLYFFQTFAFVISHNALTEPLAMGLIAFGIWAMVDKRWMLFALAGGLLVLARLELVLLLPIWAWVMFRAKQWMPMVLLVVPFLLWNLAGGLMTGDWTYVFSETVGAAGETSRYGQTPPEHYFLRYIYVVGPAVFFLLLQGLVFRIMRGRFTAFLDLQFVWGFLAYVLISWQVAAGNSAGFLRNLIPLTPLAAVLALEGFNYLLEAAKTGRMAEHQTSRWVAMGLSGAVIGLCILVFNRELIQHMLFGASYWAWHIVVCTFLLLGWLLLEVQFQKGVSARLVVGSALVVGTVTVAYTLGTEPPGSNSNPERKLVEELTEIIDAEVPPGARLHVNHIWYFWVGGKDRFDPKYAPVRQAALAQAKEGDYAFWELHYSPRLGGDVRHDYFDQHREWTELIRVRSVEAQFMAMLFVKGKRTHADAVARSADFLNRHNTYGGAWSAAGNVHLRWGDFPKAITHFQKATALDPEDADTWYNLGMAYLSVRDMKNAADAMQRSIDLDPEFPSAWFHLGSAVAGMGDCQTAIGHFTRCLELKPDYSNAWFARGTCHGRTNRLQQAADDFTKALEYDPNNVPALFNRGATYAAMRQHEAAVQDLEVALKLQPKNADAWMFLGRSQLALGNKEGGCASFGKAAGLGHPKASEMLERNCLKE